MTLLQTHVVAASAWMGLIAAEVVVELLAKDRTTRRFVAEAHKRIDLYFEGPLVAIVLLTGSILLYRLWPSATPLLLLKVAAGLIAVVSNAVCIRWVVRRARTEDDDEFFALAKKVSWTGYTIPFGVLALAMGLYGVR
jgi:putative copper export protein